MSKLRENVTIHTATGKLDGELFVGLDGWPTLEVFGGGYHEKGLYRVETFPAAWTLTSTTCGELYMAWRTIEEIRERLKEAEQEEEKEHEVKERCDVEQYKASAEAGGEHRG